MSRPLRTSLFVAASVVFMTMSLHADPILVGSFAINGSLSVTGKSNCGGLCVETITYSFQMDYFQVTSAEIGSAATLTGGTWGTPGFFVGPNYDACSKVFYGSSSTCLIGISVGPVTFSASGPLGPFNSVPHCCSWDGSYYMPFATQSLFPNDEIDLLIGNRTGDPAAGVPTPYAIGSDLFACTSATCSQDFFRTPGTAQFTATPISAPEPSALLLLAIGMSCGGVLARYSGYKRRRP